MSVKHFGAKKGLFLSVAMVTCLILLMNLSFKIILLQNMLFTSGSVLSPLIALIYFSLLRQCTITQQWHALNQSLLTLYLFSIGIYLVVNLPAAEYMRNSMAYQIVFEDIPRKFFAATLAFALSFYVPHFFFSTKKPLILHSAKKNLLLAIWGGFCFFNMDFMLLFADPLAENFSKIYIDSAILSSSLLFSLACLYLIFYNFSSMRDTKEATSTKYPENHLFFSSIYYHYLVSFAIIITLICLSCEYRIISFNNDWTLAASCILFPLTIMASNLTAELYGYKANLFLAMFIILAELVFDAILTIGVLLPSPDFFDLTPFFSFVIPHRIIATVLTLFIALAGNSFLLEKLKVTGYGDNRGLRILVANIIVNTLTCLINYSLLFGGFYPTEEIFTLALNAWLYKFIVCLLGVPLVLKTYQILKRPDERFCV